MCMRVVCENFCVFLFFINTFLLSSSSGNDLKKASGGVRPPSPPRHDTTAPEEPTLVRVQPLDEQGRRMLTSATLREDRVSPRYVTPWACARMDLSALFCYYEPSWPARV